MAETQVRDAEIVPQIPVEGVQKANSELADVHLTLERLEVKARAIEVNTPQQYAEAGELLKQSRDQKKKITYIMTPLKSIARTISEKFRTMELAELNKAERIEGIIEPKMVDQKRREREAAAAEERRINEENRRKAEEAAAIQRKADEERAAAERKAREKEIEAQRKAGEMGKREADRLKKEAEARQKEAEAQAARDAEAMKAAVQEVKVVENTPKIAGLRQRINWYAEGVNVNQFLDAYVKADAATRAFMAGFVMFDDKALGQFARQVKSDEVVMTRIPGSKAWHEDAI